MIKQDIKLNTRELFYYANELFYNNYNDEAIFYYNKFLIQNDKFIENAIQAKINLSKIYKKQNKLELAKQSLFESFLFDLPRSEALCELGHIYYENGDYKSAIYFYKLAIKKPNINSLAFIDIYCYNYIPNLQIALCYYYLKDYKNAVKFNKKAIKLNKNSKIALQNQIFYENALKNK